MCGIYIDFFDGIHVCRKCGTHVYSAKRITYVLHYIQQICLTLYAYLHCRVRRWWHWGYIKHTCIPLYESHLYCITFNKYASQYMHTCTATCAGADIGAISDTHVLNHINHICILHCMQHICITWDAYMMHTCMQHICITLCAEYNAYLHATYMCSPRLTYACNTTVTYVLHAYVRGRADAHLYRRVRKWCDTGAISDTHVFNRMDHICITLHATLHATHLYHSIWCIPALPRAKMLWHWCYIRHICVSLDESHL